MTDCKESLFRRVERRAMEHMHHDYLASRRISQSVSRFHFDVGYAILTAADVTESEIEEVLAAVLLLEQGLSIHDHVDEWEGEKQSLIVLAGDYDSSKYYFLLAGLNQSRLMYVLCDAVARINEAKMTIVLEGGRLSSQDYMGLMGIVRGELLKALASYYLGEDGAWLTHVQSLVQAHVVQDELLARRSKHNFTIRQASEWLSDSMDRVVTLPSTALVGPLYNFLVEYFRPIQETVEHMHLAEGNQ
ncbi:heptaprenyl diphosphate synthase component 1 [Alicyclobacillus dauci]|uniref:Heptaprenyl diphosphate synthase component 1 n=1 Tax=Alicyclobacillus dauci TaxID=1475485 RepID=A0ABY6YYD7_9BACL|nr:heptaprenyl diphosphate synthase component 1 [Alicyclobacillus dauci]WAH35099.1 heptaprenyl diphosphate synthase component 1 [Alicyclobacillus dauci]